MANSSNSSGGIGFAGLLTIVFVVLKLTGTIAWSWVWVLAPMWMSIALGLGIIATVGAVVGLVALVAVIMERR